MGHKRRPKRLAEKLIQIREALGLSQQEMAERLNEQAGVKIKEAIPIPGVERFDIHDPFGNRLEFMQRLEN